VAAGAVVHHSLKPWGIYAGTPLVQVGVRRKEEILKLAAQLTGARGHRKKRQRIR
jgi:acetyltransferase-like isoleucine patch superfamily enzyme